MLYLMRHGSADNKVPDEIRELSVAGREGVLKIARQLLENKAKFDFIWHSPLTRAVQTAEQVAAVFDCLDRCKRQDSFCPEDSVDHAAADIEEFFYENPAKSLLVVSHMPLLGALASNLTGRGGRGFPPAGCLALSRQDICRWKCEQIYTP